MELGRRELLKGVKIELVEEVGGRPEEDGATRRLLASDLADQPSLDELPAAVFAVDAAHLFDFDQGDRLVISDDCEHFEQSLAESLPLRFQAPGDRFGVLRLGAELLPAGNL